MVAFLQRTLLACLFLLALAVPSFGQTPVYNEYEVGKLREYFNANSISSSTCNGTMLNASYNPNDPSTYPGVTWSEDVTNKKAVVISVPSVLWTSSRLRKIEVVLDITGFVLLKSFRLYENTQSIVVKDCPLLEVLDIQSCFDEIGNISCSNLPSLSSVYISSSSLSSRATLDFSNSSSLTKFGVNSIDLKNVKIDKTKIVDLTLSRLNLTQYIYSDYPNIKRLELPWNSLTSFDPIKLAKHLDYLNLSGNCFTLSVLNTIKPSVSQLEYYTQKQILVGNEKIVGSLKVRTIGVDEVIDLSSEYKLGSSITNFVWKKSLDNTVITPKTSDLGKFTFGKDVEGQGIYCEMINDQLPNFQSYGSFTIRTCDVYIGSSFNEYNSEEVAKLKTFLNQPSNVTGKTNGQQVNAAYNPNDPSTYGVNWRTDMPEKRVGGLYWKSLSLSGNLDLSNFDKLISFWIDNNKIKTVDITNCPQLNNATCSDNLLVSFKGSKLSNLLSLNLRRNKLKELSLLDIPNGINLDCKENQLKFSTLPLLPEYNYVYDSQARIHVGRDTTVSGNTYPVQYIKGNVVDLRSEYIIDGVETKFVWYCKGDVIAIKPTTSNQGVFTFGPEYEGRYIYCEMTNSKFPKLAGVNILQSVVFHVGSNFDEYNPNEVKLIRDFLDKPSAQEGVCNGKKVNPNYDSKNPATFNISWSNTGVWKRATSIRWGGCSLMGTLDLSNFYDLTDINVSGNYLEHLVLNNCPKLTSLSCLDNKLKMSDLSYVNTITSFIYAPQKRIAIGKDTVINGLAVKYIGYETVIDLSSEYNIKGNSTKFTWRRVNDKTEITPTSSNGGKFTFDKSFAGIKIYCEITNPSLPGFTVENLLKTEEAQIGNEEDLYNAYELKKIRDFFDQPSKIIGLSNGKVWDSNYNKDNIYTFKYRFSWTNTVNDKRITEVYFNVVNGGELRGNLDLSNFTALQKVNVISTKIESINLNGCSKLTSLEAGGITDLKSLSIDGCYELTSLLCGWTQLKELNVNGLSKLKTLDLSFNNFTLLTLPYNPSVITNYTYIYQAPLKIGRDTLLTGVKYRYIKVGQVIDLSSFATVNGQKSTFTWYKDGGYSSNTITPRCISEGKFIFDDFMSGMSAVCKISNPTLPAFTSRDSYSTEEIIVLGESCDLYNPSQVKKVRDFLDQPSAVVGKTNGLLLNDNYNPTDPSTYSVGWSNSIFDRRVVDVNWAKTGLKGNLNLQNFTSLYKVYIYPSSFELNSVDVSNCLRLIDLTIANYGLTYKTDVIFKGSVNIESMQLRGCKLTSIDVSFLNKIKILWLSDNNLQSINLDNNGSLKELSIACNNFKLSTLPVNANYTKYDYNNQIDYLIGKDTLVKNVAYRYVDVDSKIDLSSEVNIRGVQSKFVWKRAGTDIIVSPTTNTNGIFTFDSKFKGEELQCEISNDLYPSVNYSIPYKTTNVVIGKSYDAYDTYEVAKLKAFLDQPSAVAGKTNGQQVNGAYNPNDPSTYGVVWSASKFNKRVLNINWGWRNIAGKLVLKDLILLKDIDLRTNELTGIEVSGTPLLTQIRCSSNNLTSISLTETSALTSVDCSDNDLKFSGLPVSKTITTYTYAPQREIQIGRDTVVNSVKLKYLKVGSVVDLSSELSIAGNATTFSWKSYSAPITPTTSVGGKFTFGPEFRGKHIYCVLSNASFPAFTQYVSLSTVEVIVGDILEKYNPEEVSKIKAFLDKPSAVAGKTNGQQLSANYNPNDPATFSVQWTSTSYDNRVVGISWGDKYLAGTLDLSNLTTLSTLDLMNNRITGLNVSGCIQLSYLRASNNLLSQLDVSTSSRLNTLYVYANRLETLRVPNNLNLNSISCYGNKLKFSTLPIIANMSNYYYNSQDLLVIGIDTVVNNTPYKYVALGKIIDLSSEATINKKPTTYTWRKRSDNSAVIPATNNGGKFTFDISLSGEIVYCEMSNATFPDLSGANSLKTVDIVIGSSFDSYNTYEVAKLKAFLEQPSSSTGKTNGQKLYSGYNPNNPATYPMVTWSLSDFDKRVISVSSGNDILSGFLDLSNFIKLTRVDIVNNYLSTLDVSGAIKLNTVNCSGNCLKFSTLPPNGSSYTNAYTYAPQRYIPIGRDTVINSRTYRYITSFKGVDLSSEKVVNGQKTLYVWKNTADGSIVTPLSSDGGVFTFPESIAGKLIYCELTNPSFPDFTGQKVLTTGPVLVEGRYNKKDVSILKRFLEQESAIAGKKNYQNIGNEVKLDDPSTWGWDDDWTSTPTNKRLKKIYWIKKDLAGSLNLSGLDSLKIVDVLMNSITSVNFDNCTRLEHIRLEEGELTYLNTSTLTGLKRIVLNNCKINSIDLSSNNILESAFLRNNQLTSVKLPTSLTFKELDLKGNSFKLSTLPSAIGPYSTYYSYSVQKPMVIGDAVKENGKTIYQVGTYSTLDLSSEFTIAGKQTEYKWWNVSKNSYITPYSSNGGKFTFDSSVVGDTLICEMKNEAFPLYDPVYPYSTVKVVVKAGYDEYEVGKLKAFLDQPSSEAGKTNGQKVNAAYDPNDPSTYGVTWTMLSIGKKVAYINWSSKGLKGDLDFSNFIQLTDLYISYNQLITAKVVGCPVLKNLGVYENQLTSIDISNCNQLGNINCRNNKLATINVSSLAKLTYLDVSNNSLASLDLSGNALLTTLNCFYNKLKFSTLPVKASLTSYNYLYQNLVTIGRDTTIAGNTFKYVGIGKTIDLSSETSINGNPTTFVWKQASDNSVVTPVTSVGGMFTFGSNLEGQTIYCEMSNATFPNFTGNDLLRTAGVVVGSDLYNAYEVGKLKAFLNQPSSIPGKTNGQQVNANYNENDPSTFFNVAWTSSSLNKKVESISWSYKSLAGNLDCSNFTLLIGLDLEGNKLIGVNVDGAISLNNMDLESNMLTSLNLSSNTKLISLDLQRNNFSYSTLPEKPTSVLYFYRVPQNSLEIGETQVSGTSEKYVIGADQLVDISKEYSVKGFQTSFTWKDSNGSVITPSTSSNGKFSFNSTFVGKKVYCEMANAGFSDFTGSNILKTVTVEILQAYNQNDVDKLKAFLNKPSAEAGKTNGQQVSASYNANDPATYGVNWSKHSANKRVVNFQWLTKNLAGDLDLSSCELLTVAWLSDNKLTSLNLKGCTELTDLDARMNELATVSMDSHPKLGSIDLSTNKLTSLSVGGVPNLSMLFLFSNQLTQLDLSKVTSLTRLKVYNNALTSLDVSGLSKLQKLKAEQNKLTSVKFGGNSKLEMVNLEGNMLSAVDVVGLPALKDLTVSNNKFNFSKIPSKNTTYTSYIYAPQAPMVVGHATQDGNITKYSIYADEPLDLSSELTIGGNTTTFVWKKADGTNVQASSVAGGVFTFATSLIGETIYGEFTNSSFPDFAADKAYRTVPVTIQSPYNAAEIAALTRFFSKPSAAAGSTNGAQVGITNQNNPQTWNGVVWSNELSDRRVISISWSGLNISDTLNLTGFSKIGALDVTSNMLNRVVVDQTPLLKSVQMANNKLRFSTMPTIGSYDQYSSFPQSKLVVGTKSADGLGDGYTLLAGELVNLSDEYDVAGQITTFVWKDNTGTAIIPTKLDKGRFSFNREFIGKKLHCELSNSKFPGGILETVEVLIPGSKFEKEFGDEISFILYPNPATSVIKVETTDLIQSYRIFASNGVLQKAGEINDFRSEIDVQGLKPGIYFIELKVGSQACRSKFIKQ